MANVLLTEKCVRSCPYCFAKEHMDESDQQMLSWQDLIYIVDLHEISGDKAIALLGGEPTLHPDFVDFVLYILERNFHVNIFTSGIMGNRAIEEAAKHLSGIDPNKLSFVCNINHPDITPYPEKEALTRFFKVFGHLTSPGYNIYEPEFELDFMFHMINQYGLKHHIRLGLAHPIPGEKNMYVKVEEFPLMYKSLLKYLPTFEMLKINVGFDCGFPICGLTDEEIGKLFKINNGRLRFGCGPAVDIGPDMMVWSCFPLSRFQKKSVFDFNSIQEIVTFYEGLHSKIKTETGGIYLECDTCPYLEEKLCSGGCMAHALSKFKNEPRLRMKEVYNDKT
ncbi:MAG: radical SAM/SPASM domain-containing protein [Bacteroidota bacterium]